MHAKPCTRTLNLYTLTRANEPAGADSMPFSGRIAHRALSPRSYMAVLTASNTAGHSKPRRPRFHGRPLTPDGGAVSSGPG